MMHVKHGTNKCYCNTGVMQGKCEGLQRQQAQLAILEAAVSSSRNGSKESLDKIALLGKMATCTPCASDCAGCLENAASFTALLESGKYNDLLV